VPRSARFRCRPFLFWLSRNCTCQNGREVLNKRRVHGCGKNYKRGSHYEGQEIVKGHVGPPVFEP